MQGYQNAGAWRYAGNQGLLGMMDPYAPGAQQDWSKLGNINATPGALAQAVQAAQTDPTQAGMGLLGSMGGGRGDSGESASGISNGFGSTAGSLNDSNSTSTGRASDATRGLSGVFGGLAGIGLGVGPVAGAKVGMALADRFGAERSYNGYGSLDGTTTAATGPGTIGSRDSYGSNESGPGLNAGEDASSLGAINGADAQSDSYGGSVGADSNGSADNGSAASASSDGADGAGWAKGGAVTRNRLIGPDPKGKDDGYGALDGGEYVIKAKTAKKLGMGLLAALNDGQASIVRKGK